MDSEKPKIEPNRDPKLMCGGGFGLPEVKRFMREELRQSVPAIEVRKLPRLGRVPFPIEPKPDSGLVQFYEIFSKSKRG